MARLFLVAGDTFRHTATVKKKNGDLYNLAGCSVWWTVKSSLSIPDDDAEVFAYWKDGGDFSMITVEDPPTGKVTVRIPSVITSTLSSIPYLYNLQVVDLVGDVFTVDEGTLTVRGQVTVASLVP